MSQILLSIVTVPLLYSLVSLITDPPKTYTTDIRPLITDIRKIERLKPLRVDRHEKADTSRSDRQIILKNRNFKRQKTK